MSSISAALAAQEPAASRYHPSSDVGPPAQLRQLGFLLGRWTAKASFIDLRSFDEPWSSTRETAAACESILGGAFISCELETPVPQGRVYRTLTLYSFDRFQRRFRVSVLDDQWALLDVYEGELREGRLVASNRETGTYGPGGLHGEFIPAGFEVTPHPAGLGFTFTWMSDFGGATRWRPVIKVEFAPAR